MCPSVKQIHILLETFLRCKAERVYSISMNLKIPKDTRLKTKLKNFLFMAGTETPQRILTHEVLVVVVVRVVDDADAVALVEAAESADAEALAVHGGATLEAGLAQALVQALAQ